MRRIRKAVIPAAGYGTRMLPITKALSKEMLPIVDKPIIQVVVEELVEAGIEDIIIVTSARKADLVNYFGDIDPTLVAYLRTGGPDKAAVLEELEVVRGLANFAFVEQQGVYGTGTPVLCAAPYIGEESFIYTFADDFFVAQKNSFTQLIEAYDQYSAPVIACQPRTAAEDYTRYGYLGGEELQPGVTSVKAIAEQPGKADTPGDLASLGGFVVTHEVLQYLRRARAFLPEGREFYFNSVFNLMIADGRQVIAREITNASYFDTGNKLEYMKTVVEMAARHAEIGTQFKQFLAEFIQEGNHEQSS